MRSIENTHKDIGVRKTSYEVYHIYTLIEFEMLTIVMAHSGVNSRGILQ